MTIPKHTMTSLVNVFQTFSYFSDEIHRDGPPTMFDERLILAYQAWTLRFASCRPSSKRIIDDS